ncbi:hypothetical protein FGB62_24g234 [Gracilaria domingensis]|nr:hypothetical protein FGB62_24g234 [Gracilaria domingensis]
MRYRGLYNALDKVTATKSFAVGGPAHTLPLPALNVANVGDISLSLSQSQADALLAVSVQSPFGRGADTVVDTSIRSSGEISPPSFSLGQAWNTVVQQLAQRMSSDLGVASGVVSAELSKLVLYQPGDFFKPHKDTEKSPGMFATVVVQLPAAFLSSALIVSHRNERKVFDHAKGSVVYLFATAFFADCEHELTEVKGGICLVLLYNLILCDGRSPGIEFVRHHAALEKLLRIAREWSQNDEPDNSPICWSTNTEKRTFRFKDLKDMMLREYRLEF